MTRLYQKIWNYKNKFLFLFVTIFILSTIKLNNINVFFESERIIEELADSDFLEKRASTPDWQKPTIFIGGVLTGVAVVVLSAHVLNQIEN